MRDESEDEVANSAWSVHLAATGQRFQRSGLLQRHPPSGLPIKHGQLVREMRPQCEYLAKLEGRRTEVGAADGRRGRFLRRYVALSLTRNVPVSA